MTGEVWEPHFDDFAQRAGEGTDGMRWKMELVRTELGSMVGVAQRRACDETLQGNNGQAPALNVIPGFIGCCAIKGVSSSHAHLHLHLQHRLDFRHLELRGSSQTCIALDPRSVVAMRTSRSTDAFLHEAAPAPQQKRLTVAWPDAAFSYTLGHWLPLCQQKPSRPPYPYW